LTRDGGWRGPADVIAVVAHIAMIFGTLDPTILAPATGHMGGHVMG